MCVSVLAIQECTRESMPKAFRQSPTQKTKASTCKLAEPAGRPAFTTIEVPRGGETDLSRATSGQAARGRRRVHWADSPTTTDEEMIKKVQCELDVWVDIVNATGGILKALKCSLFLLTFK